VGIGLANALAFTTEALLLLFLLVRQHPGTARLNGTWWRTLGAVGLGGGVVYLLGRGMPEAGVLQGFVFTLVGTAVALVWLWPELRAFLRVAPLARSGASSPGA